MGNGVVTVGMVEDSRTRFFNEAKDSLVQGGTFGELVATVGFGTSVEKGYLQCGSQNIAICCD